MRTLCLGRRKQELRHDTRALPREGADLDEEHQLAWSNRTVPVREAALPVPLQQVLVGRPVHSSSLEAAWQGGTLACLRPVLRGEVHLHERHGLDRWPNGARGRRTPNRGVHGVQSKTDKGIGGIFW